MDVIEEPLLVPLDFNFDIRHLHSVVGDTFMFDKQRECSYLFFKLNFLEN